MEREVFETPKSKNAGIYMIYNCTKHKVYIGKTLNFHSRAEHHKNRLLCNSHSNNAMQEDFNDGDSFFFVVLEDMGKGCERNYLLLREKQYIYAFKEKYMVLYNLESREQLRKNLFFDMVCPTIDEVHKDLRNKLGCCLYTLNMCNSDTLEKKFRQLEK